MNDHSRAVVVSAVGALFGGVAAYLFFTEQGRTLRRQLEPALDDIARELSSFRSTLRKAAGVAEEGRRLLDDTLTDMGPRYSSPHQTSPF